MTQDDTREVVGTEGQGAPGGAADQQVPELRWLRRMVTALAATMALGMLAVAGILWLRLSTPPLPALPGDLQLPAGVTPAAVTFARDWTVVVSETGDILLFARDGSLHRRVPGR